MNNHLHPGSPSERFASEATRGREATRDAGCPEHPGAPAVARDRFSASDCIECEYEDLARDYYESHD